MCITLLWPYSPGGELGIKLRQSIQKQSSVDIIKVML